MENANAAEPFRYQVRISEFRPSRKGTLLGFLDLSLPDLGVIVRGVALHEDGHDGRRWLFLPARPYQDGDQRRWSQVLDFTDKRAATAFRHAVLKAFDGWVGQPSGDAVRGEVVR